MHAGQAGEDIFLLPVKQCFPPPSERAIRTIDHLFLEKLKDSLCSDPYGHGGAPAIVMCSTVTSKDKFKQSVKDSYRLVYSLSFIFAATVIHLCMHVYCEILHALQLRSTRWST